MQCKPSDGSSYVTVAYAVSCMCICIYCNVKELIHLVSEWMHATDQTKEGGGIYLMPNAERPTDRGFIPRRNLLFNPNPICPLVL